MIIMTAVAGGAMAEYCAQNAQLPDCVAYMTRMATIEPFLKWTAVTMVLGFAVLLIIYRIRTGRWSS